MSPTHTHAPAAADGCPRCGEAFHCGLADTAPCACTRIELDEPTLTQMRERYDGCLCMRCLGELRRAEAGDAGTDGSPSASSSKASANRTTDELAGRGRQCTA